MHLFKFPSVVPIGAAVALMSLSLSVAVMAQKKGATQVPLRVVVHSVDSAGDFTQVTGDGRASVDVGYQDANEYVHGVDGVTAVINEHGGLTIDFQSAALSPRRLNFDYSYPDNPAFRPDLEPVIYSGLRTHLDSSNVPLLQMSVGASQCIAMGIAFNLNDSQKTSYQNSYQAKNISSVDTSGTAFGAVRRLTADTWMLESLNDGMCNGSGTKHLAKLISSTTTKGKSSGFTDHGAYHVGFSMLLTRK